jgi:hypothetical protein
MWELLVDLFQTFNELTLKPAAVVLDVIIFKLPRALYFGFRAGLVEAGLNFRTAGILSFCLVSIVLFLVVWLSRSLLRYFRAREPSLIAIRTGAALFWIGCGVGLYYVCLLVYFHADPSAPWAIIGWFGGAALFYPALGRICQYALGR